MAVLLLNASFEPLHVIPLRRAIGLVVAGKVDVIANGDGEIHSTTRTFPIPAVLRLRYMVRVPFRQHVALSRRAVLIRDQKRCQFTHCDRTASTIDHVVPRSKGGEHVWTNVVAACAPCNTRKGSRSLADLGWSLKKRPIAPRGTVVLLSSAGVQTVPDAWIDWLPAPGQRRSAAAAGRAGPLL